MNVFIEIIRLADLNLVKEINKRFIVENIYK